MTYEIPFIHCVDAYTHRLIEQALKSCDTCNDGDISLSSNGAYVLDE